VEWPDPDPGGDATLRRIAVGQLAVAVKTFVTPDGWDPPSPAVGPPPGMALTSFSPMVAPPTLPARLWTGGGRLVVLQTEDNQRRVAALLDQLRLARPAPAGRHPAGPNRKGAE
jgi:hypothetical protein